MELVGITVVCVNARANPRADGLRKARSVNVRVPARGAGIRPRAGTTVVAMRACYHATIAVVKRPGLRPGVLEKVFHAPGYAVAGLLSQGTPGSAPDLVAGSIVAVKVNVVNALGSAKAAANHPVAVPPLAALREISTTAGVTGTGAAELTITISTAGTHH